MLPLQAVGGRGAPTGSSPIGPSLGGALGPGGGFPQTMGPPTAAARPPFAMPVGAACANGAYGSAGLGTAAVFGGMDGIGAYSAANANVLNPGTGTYCGANAYGGGGAYGGCNAYGVGAYGGAATASFTAAPGPYASATNPYHPSILQGSAPSCYPSAACGSNAPYADAAYGDAGANMGEEGYDAAGFSTLDWQEQRQAEWQERIQTQYVSRWSVDKHDEWQAYQAKFEALHNGAPLQGLPLGPPQWEHLQCGQPCTEEVQSAEEYRKQHEMQVISAYSRSATPTPVQTFQAASLPPLVYSEIQQAGFTEPTPIQAQCWPILAAGHDIIGIAKSGSGKTLAFLGPGFAHVLRSEMDVQSGPMVLVLAPTRELARQIQLEALKFGRSSGIHCCAVTGGEPKGEQLEWLKRGCHVIVATPGRLNEFLEQHHVWLGQVGYTVLDEADRMLDMGFEPQIRRIIEECPKGPERQTLLFSATWPKAVRQLAFDFLRRPVHVHIGEMNTAKANTDVTQHVITLERSIDKDQTLEDLLAQHLEQDLAIVFVSTKKACQDVARRLQNHNFGVTEIHGDKDQRERDIALRSFVSKEKNVMIATDVASRGLDIKGVKLVVNYDAANTPEDYVHRIGRTGRAGEKGISYTFLVKGDACDIKKARAIQEVMQTAGQTVPDELRHLARTPVSRAKASFKGSAFKGGGRAKGNSKGGFGSKGSNFKGGKGGFKGWNGPTGNSGDTGPDVSGFQGGGGFAGSRGPGAPMPNGNEGVRPNTRFSHGGAAGRV